MSNFTHDREAFDAEVLCAQFMVDDMKRRAYLVADRAVALAAPHFDPQDTSGDHYVNLFRVEAGVEHHATKRAYGRVVNDDPAAIDIEYGTHKTPKQRILGRALDAAGA